MKNPVSLLIALSWLSLPLLLAAPASPPTRAPAQAEADQDLQGIRWRTDLPAARKDAQEQGKPILYYFRCDP